MFQDITIEELLELQRNREIAVIDVRSPSEFAESTVPGSRNLPLFNDEERARVGTLYKQVSAQAAKEEGLVIVSRKLPAFIKQFEGIEERKAVFCWRGGMRSKTTATLLGLYGIRVYRLAGGFRAYRKWVMDTLANFEFKPKCIVINGNTGTGKTVILKKLAERGYPVIDLEGLAGHRGSIFGQIGLEPSNQKTFEANLLHELLRYNDSPYVLIEAESKRIGRVVMPDFLVKAKEQGRQLFIEVPLEERVRHILEDYDPEQHKEECLAAFERIRQRMHTPIAKEIGEHLQESRFAEAVALLLEHYYDPRYEHAAGRLQGESSEIRAATMEEAVEKVIRLLPEPVTVS